jgi:hypothetical protein
MRRIRLSNDVWAGLLFMAFGAVALFLSRTYAMGDATRMGPGYFPRALGLLLVALGAVQSIRGMRAQDKEFATWHWGPLATILLGLIAFCAMLKWLGLIVAGVALVFIASKASPEFKWKEALASGVVQAAIAVALFVYGLKIPLPIWPTFIGGGG